MRQLRLWGKRQEGQTLVEFVVIAPIIFLLLFAIIDFGMYLNLHITVQHAVREGARYAAVETDCNKIQLRTQSQAPGAIPTAQYQDIVIVSYPKNPAAAGDTVKVTVKPTPYPLPIIGHAFGLNIAPLSLESSASARLEMAVTDAKGCPP
jgi:Flp pilus assembly protein TadG